MAFLLWFTLWGGEGRVWCGVCVEGGGCVVKADTHSNVNLIQTISLQISTMYSKLTRGQKKWSLHILIVMNRFHCMSIIHSKCFCCVQVTSTG